MYPELIKSEIKLTIGMLVSNHIKYIRKAMEALQPLLKAIPSELVVLDTKGAETDGSIEIVREYTDKIYPFTWCDDFAAARNACLDHARGEWFLYVDDDEWFDDVSEFIEFFQSGEYENYNSGFYHTRDYMEDGTYSMGIAGRMIRRRVNTRFVGRVHEGFNEVFSPYKHFQCFTHHMGYAFANEEAKKKHQERNVSILKKELDECGYTPRLCAQMTQELLSRKETAKEGYDFALKSISMLQKQGKLADACSQWVLVATVRYFAQKEDYEGAKRQAKYIRGNYTLSNIAKLVVAAAVLRMAGEQGDLKTMIENISQYLQQYDWLKEHKEEALVQTQLDFPQYYTETYYISVVRAGIVAAAHLKNPKLEEEYRRRIFIKSDIKLTVGMLVSNNIQYIRKTMESLKPLLEAVPSELVVMDTKGAETDGSIDIVREYTDKIYPFTWCNDFSAARNACLDHAQGEWFMYIDDDEWFDDVTEFIEFFQGEECENYNAGFYYTRDYLPEGGYSMDIAGRMIRRALNTRFEGKIHETFNEIYSPNKIFSCFTHHYGYKYTNDEERKKKKHRNLTLLNQELEEKGVNPRRAAQLVMELMGDKETMEQSYQKAMEFIPKIQKQGELMDSCSQWLLVSTVRCFCSGDMHQRLVEQAEYISKTYPLTPTAEQVLAAVVLLSALDAQDAGLALEQGERYMKCYDWRQAHEAEATTQVNLDFPRFLTEEFYLEVVHNAAKAANKLGEFKRANDLWKRMPWRREDFDSAPYQADRNATNRGLQDEKIKQYEKKVSDLMPLVEILAEAGEQVKASYAKGSVDIARQYLVGMQEVAISLGTSLDNMLGEGTATVNLLSQYCELLWNCHQTEQASEGLELAGILCEAAGLIRDTFAKDTYRPKNILLCLKRATDWPLFEPYWQEAKKNGDKVYVIPVPCFQKHPDGSFGEVIYGEEKYPEKVAIIGYEKYNYSGMTTDVIVVGEDYDNEQTFYSVHPFFYIDNIEQYTRDLIVVSEWDGGIGALERQIEELKQMVEDAKKSR